MEGELILRTLCCRFSMNHAQCMTESSTDDDNIKLCATEMLSVSGTELWSFEPLKIIWSRYSNITLSPVESKSCYNSDLMEKKYDCACNSEWYFAFHSWNKLMGANDQIVAIRLFIGGTNIVGRKVLHDFANQCLLGKIQSFSGSHEPGRFP